MKFEVYNKHGNEAFIAKLDRLQIGKAIAINNQTRVAKIVAISEMLFGVNKDKEHYLDAYTVGVALIIGIESNEREEKFPICYCQVKELLSLESNVLDENFKTKEEIENLREIIEGIKELVAEYTR